MNDLFSKLARVAAAIVAHPAAFALAVLSVLGWAVLGPSFHYSENWQLWINTSTTILTFLMIFLLQNMQNRDSRAMQVKLDELLRAIKGARTEMVDLENLTEAELSRYCDEFKALHLDSVRVLAKRATKSGNKATITTEIISEKQPPVKKTKKASV